MMGSNPMSGIPQIYLFIKARPSLVMNNNPVVRLLCLSSGGLFMIFYLQNPGTNKSESKEGGSESNIKIIICAKCCLESGFVFEPIFFH